MNGDLFGEGGKGGGAGRLVQPATARVEQRVRFVPVTPYAVRFYGGEDVLARKVAEYRKRHPSVTFASSVALLGEVVPTLQKDAPRVLACAFIGLCGAIFLMQRKILRLFVIVIPLLLAGALSLGVMGLLGVKINFYNLVVFPLAIGMGIDGAIYVTEAVLDHGGAPHFATTARGVAGA